MTRTFLALALGGACYLLTGQVIVGVLVAALSFWLLPRPGGRRTRPYNLPDLPPAPRLEPPRRVEQGDGIEVVCKQVTPLRQEWVSVKTGRLYDVLSQNGPPGAEPGDHGQVIVDGSSYRIRRASGPD